MPWIEFSPVGDRSSTVKWIGWNCIQYGGNYYDLLSFLAKTEIFAFIMVIFSEMNEKFYIHSTVFLSNFLYLIFFFIYCFV